MAAGVLDWRHSARAERRSRAVAVASRVAPEQTARHRIDRAQLSVIARQLCTASGGPYGIDARAHKAGFPVIEAHRSSNSGASACGRRPPAMQNGGSRVLRVITVRNRSSGERDVRLASSRLRGRSPDDDTPTVSKRAAVTPAHHSTRRSSQFTPCRLGGSWQPPPGGLGGRTSKPDSGARTRSFNSAAAWLSRLTN